ncbi:hypothetical protein EYF80_043196 [Liparis tanakae]|uniref:Uncharacterized protein n=1 Tax=Liparis tanakae TaxID=230148 RepID=A0A4Z2FZC7_9TELE|nr:hypothetical protein EYF80_043196 [Liparis tanakae]
MSRRRRSCSGNRGVGTDLKEWRGLLSGERSWYLCRATPPSPSGSKLQSRSAGQASSVLRGPWEIMLTGGDRDRRTYSSLDGSVDGDFFSGVRSNSSSREARAAGGGDSPETLFCATGRMLSCCAVLRASCRSQSVDTASSSQMVEVSVSLK